MVNVNSFGLFVFQGKSDVWVWGKIPVKTRNKITEYNCSLALVQLSYALVPAVDELFISK